MRIQNFKMAAALFALAVLALSVTVSSEVGAQKPAVDPEAVKVLRSMADYVSNLKQFSVSAQNVFEDVLDSGQRVDYDFTASMIISRPNNLRAERHGALEQSFFYDGKTLTLYNPTDKVYATVPAPGTIEEMFDFARESLGLGAPISDLLYSDAFPLLMQDVTLAVVVGKAVIGGVTCDHLLFSRPGVDFQVWVADAGSPLPRKYVVTDTGTPALLSITTFISDWNVAPDVTDARFTFVPPKGAEQIIFMPLETTNGSSR